MENSLVPREPGGELGTFGSERERLDALGYEEARLGMSNFDHVIDDGFADALQGGKVYGRHAAWNFNGTVWWDGKQFAEEVWVYRVPRDVLRADTLEELMEEVNDRYGSE